MLALIYDYISNKKYVKEKVSEFSLRDVKKTYVLDN